MKASFTDFEEKYSGKVFIIFSADDKIVNKDIIKEIERLKKIGSSPI